MSLADTWQYLANILQEQRVSLKKVRAQLALNSNRIDIPPGYVCAQLLFLYAATFIASTF